MKLKTVINIDTSASSPVMAQHWLSVIKWRQNLKSPVNYRFKAKDLREQCNTAFTHLTAGGALDSMGESMQRG